MLTLVLSGAAEVASGTRSVELRPGDVSLLESREPFRKTCSADYREQFFYLPRAFVDATAGVRFASGGQLVAPREGMGQVLADTITSFARHRRVIPAHDWQPLVTGITQVAAAVFTDRASSEETQPTIRALTRARVERYIDAHLDDPTLSPPLIAARIGCSVRYLHLIFEGSGTSIGATLLARRLERCHQRLTDPREAHRSISEIAFAAGFNDAAHFSRTFKARFGISPRELRSLDRPPRRATPE